MNKHCICGKNGGAKDGDVCPNCGEMVTPESLPRQKRGATAFPAVESKWDRAISRLLGERIEDAGGPIGNRMSPLKVCNCEDSTAAPGETCPICGNMAPESPTSEKTNLVPPTHKGHPRFKLKFEKVLKKSAIARLSE